MLHEIEEADLRDRIEQVVEEYPRYGYRRVTHHLRREGFKVNHKRVSRIMREESLQCQVKRHWVKTTDSDHPYRVYPNLLKAQSVLADLGPLTTGQRTTKRAKSIEQRANSYQPLAFSYQQGQ